MSSPISSSVSLIILSFWAPNYIGEKAVTATRERRHRSVEVTPSRRRGINISRQSPHRQVLAAKNSYRWRQSPSTTRWLLLKWKSAQRRRKHCVLAVVRRRQKFSLRRSPLPGSRDGQNLISWRWLLPLPTNPVWWKSMHAISSYRGNSPTHTPTNKQTGPITIHCAAASAQCNNHWWQYNWPKVSSRPGVTMVHHWNLKSCQDG